MNRGDVEEGFRQADVILEEKYKTHLIQHTTMEPRVTVASWSGKRLTLWDSHKNPFRLRTDLAQALNLKVNQVRVLTPYIGGDFGDKGSMERQHIIAALLAKKTNRPVKIEFTREENYLSAHHRYPTTWYLKYGAKKDGTLTAIQVKLYADMGAYYHLDGAVASLEVAKVGLPMPQRQAGRLQRLHQQAGGGLHALRGPPGRDVPPGGAHGPSGGEAGDGPSRVPPEELCPEGGWRPGQKGSLCEHRARRVRQAGRGEDRLGGQLEETRDEPRSREEGAGRGLPFMPARRDLVLPCPPSSSSIPTARWSS